MSLKVKNKEKFKSGFTLTSKSVKNSFKHSKNTTLAVIESQ